jgi:hypothetical protein
VAHFIALLMYSFRITSVKLHRVRIDRLVLVFNDALQLTRLCNKMVEQFEKDEF